MDNAIAEASPFVRTQSNLSMLKLDQMAASLPDYVRLVSEGEADFVSALAEMTAAVVGAREVRILGQRIRSSGFPSVKTLADFDWSFQPSVPRPKVEELATLRFVDRAENALFVGSPGVGKTHLAIALGIEAVKAGREVRFMDCARLVDDFKDAQARGILKKRLKYYATPSCSSSTSWDTSTSTRAAPTCSSSWSARGTSRGRRSSPPTWASEGGPRCSGTRWPRAPSPTGSAAIAA